MNIIEARAARLELHGRVILEGADFTVAPGEFIALLGPNGAGKTTLLRALLGLVTVASGSLRVLGGVSPGHPVLRGDRRIGYMPQARANLAPRLAGRDLLTIAAGAGGWGLPRSAAHSRAEVDAVLAMVGVEHLAERPLSDLSGGQRQRLLLAQALLGRPALLLLDEPLISLDPPGQASIVALAGRLCREQGTTVVFSAHELSALLGHVDRVLYLGQGHALIGHPDDVIRSDVLSRLYGGPVEVVRAGGRVFVVAGPEAASRDEHHHHA